MKKNKSRNIAGILIIVLAVALAVFLELKRNNISTKIGGEVTIEIDTMDKKLKAVRFPEAKEIVNPAGFINTDGATIEELIGKKVILVDFWTFSCINCQRTTPYLNSWYEKYEDKGLEIIGVHTPEFNFEKDIDNVKNAVERLSIKYPVVLDNDYSTWNAYQNRYWPRKYLIDIDGFIVYDHIGEGAYEETEKKIQELLKERMKSLGMDETIDKGVTKPKDTEEVDPTKKRSPEIYFGALRNTYLGNGETGKTGVQNFAEPQGLKANILYLDGEWDIKDEFAQNLSSEARIIFRYQAQKVFIVASSQESVIAKILVDGKPVTDKAGSDIKNSLVIIKEDRLYRLIEGLEHGEHTLEIIIEGPGLRAFAFTFG